MSIRKRINLWWNPQGCLLKLQIHLTKIIKSYKQTRHLRKKIIGNNLASAKNKWSNIVFVTKSLQRTHSRPQIQYAHIRTQLLSLPIYLGSTFLGLLIQHQYCHFSPDIRTSQSEHLVLSVRKTYSNLRVCQRQRGLEQPALEGQLTHAATGVRMTKQAALAQRSSCGLTPVADERVSTAGTNAALQNQRRWQGTFSQAIYR